jgi:hypothetical protein
MIMTKNRHILLAIAGAFAALVGMVLLLLSRSPRIAYASPGTLYVAPPPGGSDGNPCSLGQPCATVQHTVDVALPGDEILVATGVYTGVQARGGMTQVVYISKTVTLRGGYSGGFAIQDPDTYPTTLDAQGQGRVVSIVGASGPTLEGFAITGGNAHGVTANCPNAGGLSDGCGGGIFAYSGSPIIMNNVVSNNVAAVSTVNHSASGGGICLVYPSGAVISGNLLISNTASLGERGRGGGIHLEIPNNVSVMSNQILSNTATTHDSLYGWGGGLSIEGGGAGTVQGNRIAGNRTNGGGGGQGSGIYQWQGSITFTGNQVTGNHGGQAVLLGYSTSRFESNQVVDNDTSIGVRLYYGAGDGPALANNVIARSGDRSFSAFGLAGNPLTATLVHNTLVGPGTGYGVYVESGYVTLALTNTIVASHTWSITNTVPASSTVTADHTLFWVNDHDDIQGTNAVTGDPAFLDPGGGDYHLGLGSAAIDAGVEAGESVDIDGESRPLNLVPDIGADEAWWREVFLPLILRAY